MKKLVLLLLIGLCGQYSNAQVINDNFPLGHYKFSQDSYSISFDFFEDGSAKVAMRSKKHYSDRDNIDYYSTYKLNGDSISLSSGNGNNFSIPFYKKSDDIEGGYIRLTWGDEDEYSYSSFYYAVGKNIKSEDFKSFDESIMSNYSESSPYSLKLAANPGDSLILQYRDYSSYSNFYYVIPKDGNDIYLKPKKNKDDFVLDFMKAYKGESSNEIKIAYANESDVFSLYFVRPTIDKDKEFMNNAQEIPQKEGWTFFNVAKSDIVKISYDDYGSVVYEDDAYKGARSADSIKYYTSYNEALKQAKKDNKLLRVYCGAPSDECTESLYRKIRSINEYTDYYGNTVAKTFNSNYILVILPESDKKYFTKYQIQSYPAYFITSPDEQLLYVEKSDCTDSPYFSGDSDYSVKYFDSYILMKYNQMILEPQMQSPKPVDNTVYKKYFSNVAKIVSTLKSDYSYYSWSDLQSTMKSSSYLENDGEFVFPEYSIIGSYLDKLSDKNMKLPLDTTIARSIIVYYSNIVNDQDLPNMKEFPASMKYLLKYSQEINKYNMYGDQQDYYNTINTYNLLKKALPTVSSYYSEGKVSQKDAVSIYKGAIQAAPQYRDFLIYSFCEYVSFMTGNLEADAYSDVIEFLSGYLSEFTSQKDVNQYLIGVCKKMYEVDKSAFKETFSYYYDDDILANSTFKRNLALILNNAAWQVYMHKFDDKYLAQAVKWAETAVNIGDSGSKYIYLDTYATLLYRSGKKSEAIELQKEAYTLAKYIEEPNSLLFREIKVNLKMMELGILGDEN